MDSYSPIQVLLDARQFQRDRERTPGPRGNREFFLDQAQAFVAHKAAVTEQLQTVRKQLLASSAGRIGFVRVQMRDAALAKSHHPMQSLFQPNLSPLVGSGASGQLIFQVSPSTLDHTLTQVASAEDEVPMVPSHKNPDILEPAPSRPRSELGAIAQLELWGSSDRRKFSTRQAVNWFTEHAVPQAYRVDLFEAVEPVAKAPKQDYRASDDLIRALLERLDERLDCGYVGALYRPTSQSVQRLYLWLREDSSQRLIVASGKLSKVLQSSGRPALDEKNHQRLLQTLDDHAAVRRVTLPPALRSSATARPLPALPVTSLLRTCIRGAPQAGASYPVLGIIDGGISELHEEWVVYRSQHVADIHSDPTHGSEIAALMLYGQQLNTAQVCPEPDGCLLADLAMIPSVGHYNSYYGSEIALVDDLEQQVIAAKARSGVRIFSFSHNFEHAPGHAVYSELSGGIDRIAHEQDVIFVISTGNNPLRTGRKEWSADPLRTLSELASITDDRLTAPADSIFSVAVAALNPPGASTVVAGAPARYSRRGPSFKQFVKPDVAHYGGACGSSVHNQTGLHSVNLQGGTLPVFGTSYSAPLVAKTLARYDQMTGGQMSREALIALLIHSAKAPPCLSVYNKADVTRHFVGFGLPDAAENLLNGTPHQATLMFFDRMLPKKDLYFNFDWPRALVEDGKCRGEAIMTLVYTPPVVDAHDGELVRVNLDAVLQQRDVKGKWSKRAEDAFGASLTKNSGLEKHLVDEGLKWGVVKQVRFESKRGVGASSEWRIWLKYLLRSTETFPEEGIPFAVVLTISDKSTNAPVYQDMKIGLTSRNVYTEDIRALGGRVQLRGGAA